VLFLLGAGVLSGFAVAFGYLLRAALSRLALKSLRVLAYISTFRLAHSLDLLVKVR
jgi:hypothetical protein